jgi:small subunit ribosomal protein S6
VHHEYETIVIARPDLDDATIDALLTKLEGIVTDAGGKVLDRDDWGKRKLAYSIAKSAKGHYVRMHLAAPADVIAQLERRIRLEDQLVRFMTIQLAKAIDVDERAEAAAVVRAAREEEARKRAEAEAAAAAAAAEYEAEQRQAMAAREADAAAAESNANA